MLVALLKSILMGLLSDVIESPLPFHGTITCVYRLNVNLHVAECFEKLSMYLSLCLCLVYEIGLLVRTLVILVSNIFVLM